jgi:hypothetical protein
MTIEFELEEFPVCNYSLQLNSIEQIEKVLAKMKPICIFFFLSSCCN